MIYGGLGFMDFWMGMIVGNTFVSAEDAEGRGEHLLSTEDTEN